MLQQKQKIISEKTSIVIGYGDSIFSSSQKHLIKNFQSFFQKKLSKYFNTVHFLPFYPSSSDSGFAVKDHYKIDNRLGNWSDIKKFSKKNDIMADIVINHSSARGLWFKNFLKEKKPGKDYFLTVNSDFNVPYRQDYSISLSSDTDPFWLSKQIDGSWTDGFDVASTVSVKPDNYQEATHKVRMKDEGRYSQITIQGNSGSTKVTSVMVDGLLRKNIFKKEL